MDEILNPGQVKPKSSTGMGDFEVPFDIIELPSKGVLYKGTTLDGKESLKIQYMTAAQEDILTSPNLYSSGRLLEVLLRSVIKDVGIDPNELLIGDRNTILVWLRSTGYGEKYPVTMQCGKCGSDFENEFDLSTLKTKGLEKSPDENNLFSYVLPVSKKQIKFKLLNCKEEQVIAKQVENNKGQAINNAGSLTLFNMIQDVDGNTDRGYIKKFVENMLVKDSKSLRGYYGKLEPGIVLLQKVVCSNCGYETKEVIPVRDNFFWPDD